MRTMNEFGIVLFAGAKDVTTLPTLVYSQAISRGNYQVAAIAALVNIVLSLGLYSSTDRSPPAPSEVPVLVRSRSGRIVVHLITAVVIVALFVLPFAVLSSARSRLLVRRTALWCDDVELRDRVH